MIQTVAGLSRSRRHNNFTIVSRVSIPGEVPPVVALYDLLFKNDKTNKDIVQIFLGG